MSRDPSVATIVNCVRAGRSNRTAHAPKFDLYALPLRLKKVLTSSSPPRSTWSWAGNKNPALRPGSSPTRGCTVKVRDRQSPDTNHALTAAFSLGDKAAFFTVPFEFVSDRTVKESLLRSNTRDMRSIQIRRTRLSLSNLRIECVLVAHTQFASRAHTSPSQSLQRSASTSHQPAE